MTKSARPKKASLQERVLPDWKDLFLLVRLFWDNEFKGERKGFKAHLIRGISYVVLFAVLTYVSSLFFSLCARLNIFSVFSFVPLSVVSLLTEAVFWLGFISALADLMKILYFSDSAKSLVSLPCNSNTIFFAHLVFFYLKESLKTLLVEVPFSLGFMLAAGYPWYYFMIPVLIWLLFTLLEVSFISAISVPCYYVVGFFKRHLWLSSGLLITLVALFIYLVFYLLSFIPDRISIFANWGPYFTAIQNTLRYYINHFYFSYGMTQLALGDYNGMTIVPFGGRSLIVLAITLGVIAFCFLVTLFLVNPVYFSIMTAQSDSKPRKVRKEKAGKERPFVWMQLLKEIRLQVEDPSSYLGTFAIFAFLPAYVMLLNKIFGAMDTNDFGNILIQVFNLLIILLVAFNTNLAVADDYLSEKDALALSKTYPRRQSFLLLSKLILPALVGTISVILSMSLYCWFKKIQGDVSIFLSVAASAFYLGHLLFSAGLGFEAPPVRFGSGRKENNNLLLVTLSAFFLAILIAVIYYLSIGEDYVVPSLKLMIAGLVFLGLNILLCAHKIAYLYKEQE